MRAFLRVIFAAAVVSATAFPLLAQNSPGLGRTSIRGSVRDAVTHQPLYRVIIDVESQSGGNAAQVVTDSTGKFDVPGLDAEVFLVRVRFPGYEEAIERVDLTVSSSNYLDFQLKPKPGAAPPAVAPEGPDAKLNARLASVPEKARKEFAKAGELWQEGKDMQGCVDHLNKAIKDYPKFADAYVLMASADMQMHNVADAKAALDKAIAIDPKLSDARLTLGKIQNLEKDFVNAEKSLSEALRLDDSSAEGHYELARAYFGLKRWDDAEPHVQKAITLMPNLAPAHFLAGYLALRRNDASGALKEFHEYLNLDPNGPMAEGAQQMIKKIQDAIGPQAQQ